MNVYKLQYASKESLDSALVSRNVIDEEGNYLEGTQAVVYLGNLLVTPAVFDSEGNEVSPAVFSDKYHADIMVEGSLSFSASNLVTIAEDQTPAHTFGQ